MLASSSAGSRSLLKRSLRSRRSSSVAALASPCRSATAATAACSSASTTSRRRSASRPRRSRCCKARCTAQIMRVNLRLGRRTARRSPAGGPTTPRIPADPAYDWSPYDRADEARGRSGRSRCCSRSSARPAGPTAARPATARRGRWPTCSNFATAAAKRYSGDFTPPGRRGSAARRPSVAGLERAEQPGLPPPAVAEAGKGVRGRQPASTTRRSATRSSPGVHSTRLSGEKVACGATAPRGNNRARRSPARRVSPLVFLTRR